MEAINQTEADNRRWIWQRQRNQSERDEAHHQAMLAHKNQSSGKLVERFVSRRGTLNVVHFAAMEHVPDILRGNARAPTASSTSSASTTLPKCVVTGLPARYRDPRTGLPYYNAAAFKEIRRRHSQPKAPPPNAATQKAETTANVAVVSSSVV